MTNLQHQEHNTEGHRMLVFLISPSTVRNLLLPSERKPRSFRIGVSLPFYATQKSYLKKSDVLVTLYYHTSFCGLRHLCRHGHSRSEIVCFQHFHEVRLWSALLWRNTPGKSDSWKRGDTRECTVMKCAYVTRLLERKIGLKRDWLFIFFVFM